MVMETTKQMAIITITIKIKAPIINQQQPMAFMVVIHTIHIAMYREIIHIILITTITIQLLQPLHHQLAIIMLNSSHFHHTFIHTTITATVNIIIMLIQPAVDIILRLHPQHHHHHPNE